MMTRQVGSSTHLSGYRVNQDLGPKPLLTMKEVDILLREGTEVYVYCHRGTFSSTVLADLGRMASQRANQTRFLNGAGGLNTSEVRPVGSVIRNSLTRISRRLTAARSRKSIPTTNLPTLCLTTSSRGGVTA